MNGKVRMKRQGIRKDEKGRPGLPKRHEGRGIRIAGQNPMGPVGMCGVTVNARNQTSRPGNMRRVVHGRKCEWD